MDWLWFLLWIVTFAVAMYYWYRWREERSQRELKEASDLNDAEFSRSYARYRQAQWADYRVWKKANPEADATDWPGYISHEEWRRAEDN
ncbi:hypothetical protein SEA_HUNTINGDON_39 [Arthrobacter phage Huntingdon]|uniref:Uncharacterized protein n=1 Tax=Arthrobacter phage Huntingdon TaxID=2047760 RepID=A0A2H4PAH5_9CAUD|nr:hypothetical protein KDJ00_gp39 [Arthrobacter phage Huntingdon]AOQ28251.1 hypothetical protein SEA_RCIGASTRUGA_39 [Arthrobacter phage RcigaStruga]ATW59246.1 hypothetical protein SEA_HUNTINGDON_39 [Arthrobacter phage Huntingdon]